MRRVSPESTIQPLRNVTWGWLVSPGRRAVCMRRILLVLSETAREKVKETSRCFKESKPGLRFEDHYHDHQRSSSGRYRLQGIPGCGRRRHSRTWAWSLLADHLVGIVDAHWGVVVLRPLY